MTTLMTAAELANMVPVKAVRDGFEPNGALVGAIDLSNNRQYVRVFQQGKAITEYIETTADIIRAADKLLNAKIDAMNDEFDSVNQ